MQMGLFKKLAINKGNTCQIVIGIKWIIFESNTVRFDRFSKSGYRAHFVASVSFGVPFRCGCLVLV